jgi:hypothetical protein
MADGRIYVLQPSFASGEISPDVASRVDLGKYQNALLQAENVFIRPYGSAYRRPGTMALADIGISSVRLQEFAAPAGSNGFLLVFQTLSLKIYQGSTKKATLVTPYTLTDLPKLRFAQSADTMFIASGTHPVQVLKRLTDTSWTITDFVPSPGYFDPTTMTDGVTITPSATTGTVTLTASSGVFSSGQVGNWIELDQSVDSTTENLTQGNGDGTSNSVLCGPEGWKIITHGTWKGTVSVEYSLDDVNWKTLRTYSSDSDFNASESGTFDELTYVRVSASITSGTVHADISNYPFTNRGTAKITGYTDSTHVTATVKDKFINTSAADEWAFGSWSADYGYPSCVTFFQDRLCFAANNRKPYMVWMSRTGDYYNFGTERVEGTLTDDSAVAVSFITRRDFRILHLMAHSDLLVMTEGNEWIVNGSETVTPTNVTPRVQTSRGTTDVTPTMIGGQIIYVQRHGKTVRDMQYNFGTDSYDGMDLSILAKHITENATIIDGAYKQEPDYMMFFVLDDGTCACLTYVKEQNVYAWSRIKTQGAITGVETVETVDGADVYLTVFRYDSEGNLTQFLEVLTWTMRSEFPDDYAMVDCAFVADNGDTPSTVIHIPPLANYTIDVLADGRAIKGITLDENGDAELDVPAYYVIAGLRYESVFELPNIELQLQDGTLQGRRKKVAEVILRLDNSLGGRVGITTAKTDVIKYDELENQEVTLYSGEKIVTVPNVAVGGFNDKGRIVVTSDDPYPLSISSIVRAVVPGG